jgi:hypothetical protein
MSKRHLCRANTHPIEDRPDPSGNETSVQAGGLTNREWVPRGLRDDSWDNPPVRQMPWGWVRITSYGDDTVRYAPGHTLLPPD